MINVLNQNNIAMKMKKTALLLGVGLMVVGLMIFPTEQSQAQVRFGIKGGINFANMKYEAQDETSGVPDANSFTSYHVGVIADVPIASVLSLQPGVMLTSVGSKVEAGNEDVGGTYTMNPLYVRVPVNILFKPNLGGGTKLYVGVGPYVGFGVGGKVSVDGNVGDIEGGTDRDLKFGNDSGDDLKSRDIGGNVLAGIEFSSGFLLGAQYGMSFTNNAPNGDDNADNILKNKVLSVSVGYLF